MEKGEPSCRSDGRPMAGTYSMSRNSCTGSRWLSRISARRSTRLRRSSLPDSAAAAKTLATGPSWSSVLCCIEKLRDWEIYKRTTAVRKGFPSHLRNERWRTKALDSESIFRKWIAPGEARHPSRACRIDKLVSWRQRHPRKRLSDPSPSITTTETDTGAAAFMVRSRQRRHYGAAPLLEGISASPIRLRPGPRGRISTRSTSAPAIGCASRWSTRRSARWSTRPTKAAATS
jgi:hypothetical protein